MGRLVESSALVLGLRSGLGSDYLPSVDETRSLRRGIRWVVLWAGGGLLALIGLAYVAFVMLGVLLVSGQHRVAGVPVTADQLVGRWSSPTHGSITFAADGGLTIRQVPLRGVTAQVNDSVAPVDRSGWTWRVNESQSTGGTALCYYADDGGGYCTWDVTRPNGQLELDLVVGDPDMRQAYRYVNENGG